MPDSKTKKSSKKFDQYNDPSHNYLRYWDGRDYENAAEEVAIRRLLRGRHFKEAVDIGGGYGRLCLTLKDYADHVTLAEPSQQQLDIAEEFLKDHKTIARKLAQADNLPFSGGTIDLAVMVRVMHHLPDPTEEFKDIARIVKSGGFFLLEVANYTHAKNRLKYMVKLQRMPREPVDIRSAANKKPDEIAFVNHNPKTVQKQLAHAGFKVVKVLSVSNLRSTTLKKVLPKRMLLSLEKGMQPALARAYFGPSTFFLLQKV